MTRHERVFISPVAVAILVFIVASCPVIEAIFVVFVAVCPERVAMFPVALARLVVRLFILTSCAVLLP